MNVDQVAHLVPVSTIPRSLSRFKSTAIGNGLDVSDGSEKLPSKDLAALSVRIFLDGLSVDMVIVKRERRMTRIVHFRAALLLPTVVYHWQVQLGKSTVNTVRLQM